MSYIIYFAHYPSREMVASTLGQWGSQRPTKDQSIRGCAGVGRGEEMGSFQEAVEWSMEGTEVLRHWHTQAYTHAARVVHPHGAARS